MIMRDFLFSEYGAVEEVDVGEWQSSDIKGDRSKVTWEIREASLHFGMPDSIVGAAQLIRPNLPWAEDHFQERVGGAPLNPPPSQAWWPFAQNGHQEFVDGGGKFSHTYPERFWPKYEQIQGLPYVRSGIRFNYGDYGDVIDRLVKNPLTRQAYLPIYFPEDNGAPEGERVPCTLGYLFLIRNNQLHLTYYIRSCDFMRHWRDDVYMGVRLAIDVMDQLNYRLPPEHPPIFMGEMAMHIGSFHIFDGDLPRLTQLQKETKNV